jgi:primary-amine oxidase
MDIVRMDYLATGKDSKTEDTQPWESVNAVEYHADLIDTPLRRDLKPLIVLQLEGASFTVNGQKVHWQKWDFHLSFNWREGPVLNNVSYDGRSVLYRVSLSEMTVPYADPRAPFHRKQAFDLGDLGLGLCANELTLECDCLGKYVQDRYFNLLTLFNRTHQIFLIQAGSTLLVRRYQ